FFFFQAEDGIRDFHVTGVQTCALPIYTKGILNRLRGFETFLERNPAWREKVKLILIVVPSREAVDEYDSMKHQIDETVGRINGQIGRASCRERVEKLGVHDSLKTTRNK